MQIFSLFMACFLNSSAVQAQKPTLFDVVYEEAQKIMPHQRAVNFAGETVELVREFGVDPNIELFMTALWAAQTVYPQDPTQALNYARETILLHPASARLYKLAFNEARKVLTGARALTYAEKLAETGGDPQYFWAAIQHPLTEASLMRAEGIMFANGHRAKSCMSL